MAPYRIYFCSRDRKVFASNDFDAKDDAAAVDHGRRLALNKAPYFEIWQESREVYSGGTRP